MTTADNSWLRGRTGLPVLLKKRAIQRVSHGGLWELKEVEKTEAAPLGIWACFAATFCPERF